MFHKHSLIFQCESIHDSDEEGERFEQSTDRHALITMVVTPRKLFVFFYYPFIGLTTITKTCTAHVAVKKWCIPRLSFLLLPIDGDLDASLISP